MSQPSQKKRPLSPHLQVYKPQMTSTMSILNRITGVALTVGLFMFSAWIISAALGADAFGQFHSFAYSWIGKVMLFGWTFALMFHLLNGVRHLVWDTGRSLSLKGAYQTGWIVIIGTIIASVFIIIKAYGVI